MDELEKLKERAKELRKKTFDLAVQHKETHVASAFSIIELLIALYDYTLTREDKFILSKGHGCFSLYTMLRDKGFNPEISGHPDIQCGQGICCTTGSLGHGLPIAVGMALARKLKKKPGKIYIIMGDGECQEGTIWESSNLASYYKLDNLIAIVDHNKLQAMDRVEKVLSLGDLRKKFEAFGWYVSEVNGHDVQSILSAIEKSEPGKPRLIIAHTIKGKGLSYMENDPKWQSRFPNEEELKQSYIELDYPTKTG